MPALPEPSARRHHRGVSLLFALLTLAAMSLAAVALVRSVDTASLVAGNLGFKQASVAATGQAAESALARLIVLRDSGSLNVANVPEAYYPSAFANLDVRDRSSQASRSVVDWNDDNCATPYTTAFAACLESREVDVGFSGNRARYVITRLCDAAGAASPTNPCAKPVNTAFSQGASTGGLSYAKPCPDCKTVDPGPYYRIVVRTVGARNTVSYTETIVHF